jgi:hypothetical protein
MLTNLLHHGSRLAVILAPLTLAAFWGDPEEGSGPPSEDGPHRPNAANADVEPGVPQPASTNTGELIEDVHAQLFRDNDDYPSARKCAQCHEEIYDEWRSSAHAYSGLSPMFHRFEQTLNFLASGTVGAFCVRCHLPVGTAAGQPRHMSLPERAADFERFEDPYVSIEGVTCVACHRVNQSYGRVNGERFIVPGTIFEPMYGIGAGGVLEQVKQDQAGGDIAFSEQDLEQGKGRIRSHSGIEAFDELNKSQFCMTCHQVAVHPGIKLEVVWDQYLDSPAHAAGGTCQDCHMGQTPGKWSADPIENYAARNDAGEYIPTPRAKVDGTDPYYYAADGTAVKSPSQASLADNLHRNHSFIGPGYSIAHPGIFPHTAAAMPMIREDGWVRGPGYEPGESTEPTIDEWLQFDWQGDWGTEAEFAEGIRPPADHPAGTAWVWSNAENRKRAREVIEENQAALRAREKQRQIVMENGSHLDGPFFDSKPRVGRSLRLHYDVTNECEGHNFPSGSLGAQPQVWLNVALIDPDGVTRWESGNVDPDGDIADLHSSYVQQGLLEHDDQLFNLQSKFLTTNVKGTDREMYLPVNMDVDQVPFIRPAGVPSTVLNHPPFIRMEQKSIPPLTTREAKYKIPGDAFAKPGTYKLAVRLRSRAEPIYFMKFVGASPEMIQRMNERMLDIHPYVVEFEVR